MPNIGPLEVVIVLAILVLIVGTARLSPFAKSLGSGIREFKGAVTGHRQVGEEAPSAERQRAATDRSDQSA